MEDAAIKRLLVSDCNNVLKTTTFYILPFFQFIAVIVNFSSAFIFFSWKYQLYRYLGTNSIIDGILFILNIMISQTMCKQCDQNFILTYWFQFFQLYFIFYLHKVVETISTIINIKIAIDRYLIVQNGFSSKTTIKKHLILIIISSIVIHSYYLFFVKVHLVHKLNNETFTFLELNNSNETTKFYVSFLTAKARNSRLIQLILVFGQNIISMTFLILMIVLSILLYLNFQKSQKTTGFIVKFNKNGVRIANGSRRVRFTDTLSTTIENSKENKKITQMIIWISIIFILDNLLTIFIASSHFILGRRTFLQLTSITIIYFFKTGFSLLNVLFYCIFYSKYKKVFKNYLFKIGTLILFVLLIVLIIFL